MRLLHFLVLPALTFGFAWVACGEPLSHPYEAEQYDPDADCLFPGRPIDVVSGAPTEGGFCDAICISDLDGGVWVSGECPPYPAAYDLTGKDPACPAAFAATCRQCPIDADGGGVHVICEAGAHPHEAGDDASSGGDAARAAGHDANPSPPTPKDARADGAE